MSEVGVAPKIFEDPLKFIYSEKATKFCDIFPLRLTTVHTVKSKGNISQKIVAFSEYMNFTKLRQCVAIETYLFWVWGRYSLTLLILWIVTITCSRNWCWTCGYAAIREKFFEGCLGTTSWMFWSPFLIPFVLWKIKEKQPWLVWPLTSWHLSKGYVY